MNLFIDFNGIVCDNYDYDKLQNMKYNTKKKNYNYCLILQNCTVLKLTQYGWSPHKTNILFKDHIFHFYDIENKEIYCVNMTTRNAEKVTMDVGTVILDVKSSKEFVCTKNNDNSSDETFISFNTNAITLQDMSTDGTLISFNKNLSYSLTHDTSDMTLISFSDYPENVKVINILFKGIAVYNYQVLNNIAYYDKGDFVLLIKSSNIVLNNNKKWTHITTSDNFYFYDIYSFSIWHINKSESREAKYINLNDMELYDETTSTFYLMNKDKWIPKN